MTQQQRLLQAFKAKGELFVYEIMAPRPNGLGIAQYNARIKELREQGHKIVNVEKGHFKYVKERTAPMGDVTNSESFKKFQQMGAFIKGQAQKPDIKSLAPEPNYEEMGIFELKSRLNRAEAWLRENQDHPKWVDALARRDKIEQEITTREVKSELM